MSLPGFLCMCIALISVNNAFAPSKNKEIEGIKKQIEIMKEQIRIIKIVKADMDEKEWKIIKLI